MTARRLLILALSLAAALYPGVANGQREVRIPLHHGCGELVYTRNAGWSHCADTAGTLHFPRYYVFDGDFGHDLRSVSEYDADSVFVRKWRMFQTLGGIAVEQEALGRSLYQFDSLGYVQSVRHESPDGEERSNAVDTSPEGTVYVCVYNAGGDLIGYSEGSIGTVVYDPGFGAEGEVVTLADPLKDPGLVLKGSSLEIVSKGDVRYSLNKVHAYEKSNHGLIKGLIYLKRESDYYGLLDFARNGNHPLGRGTYYVSHTAEEGALAHDNYNFGNFLWGAAAQAVGVPLWIARLGAHLNNMKFAKGKPDSPDDQLSISAGYHFAASIDVVK